MLTILSHAAFMSTVSFWNQCLSQEHYCRTSVPQTYHSLILNNKSSFILFFDSVSYPRYRVMLLVSSIISSINITSNQDAESRAYSLNHDRLFAVDQN